MRTRLAATARDAIRIPGNIVITFARLKAKCIKYSDYQMVWIPEICELGMDGSVERLGKRTRLSATEEETIRIHGNIVITFPR